MTEERKRHRNKVSTASEILIGSIAMYCLKLMGYDVEISPLTEDRAKNYLDRFAKNHGLTKKAE